MCKKYDVDRDLYLECKKRLQSESNSESKAVDELLEELPYRLKVRMQMVIYDDLMQRIRFFKKKSSHFVAWFSQML